MDVEEDEVETGDVEETEDVVDEEEDEEELESEPRREELPLSSSLTGTRVSSSPRERLVHILYSSWVEVDSLQGWEGKVEGFFLGSTGGRASQS